MQLLSSKPHPTEPNPSFSLSPVFTLSQKVYFSLLIYEQNAVGLWKTLYVCVTNINAKHRRPGMEELSVEKKRIVSLVMSSLQHPTNT